jgi:hypothetical protein
MSTALLSIPPLELCQLWGELVECYHGVHSYGSDTAEIYAYRFYSHNPILDSFPREKEAPDSDELELRILHAAQALSALCQLFTEIYCCDVYIEGALAADWFRHYRYTFTHRAHVRVARI